MAAEVFLYNTAELLDALELLQERDGELKDYGDQLVPYLVQNATVAEHRLEGYWRDLGTPENYFQAHMDLLDGTEFPFDSPDWPILTEVPRRLPAFVAAGAQNENSLLAPRSTIHGRVIHSVIGPDTVVEAGAAVRDSVLLEGVTVAAGTDLNRTIIDAGARLEGGQQIDGTEQLVMVDRSGQQHI